MPTDVTMPRLSDTMEEGKIIKWMKHVGDRVAVGDVLAEVETDKANMELEAFDEGTLSEIRVAEGESASVGAVIAVLDGEGAAAKPRAPKPAPAAKAAPPQPPPAARPKAAPPQPAPAPKAPAAKAAPPPKRPPARPEPEEEPEAMREAPADEPAPVGAQAEGGVPEEAPRPAAKAPAPKPSPASGTRVAISPRARRIASERGIDLGAVRGSGPGGRILEQDLEAREAARPVGQRVELSKIRRTTAARMAAATREVPHFYASTEIVADELVRLKDELRARGGAWESVTITHILLKGVGMALREVPEMNGSWSDGALMLHPDVNIGIAVAIDDGLVVPVVRRCDTEPLEAIVARASDLVARARAGRFAGDDLLGATFTVSNLGMYPVVRFAAVVNPPHAGILAVGATRTVPVVRDGKIAVGQLMELTLSCDHRVVDGVIAGRFLREVKARLEDPRALLG